VGLLSAAIVPLEPLTGCSCVVVPITFYLPAKAIQALDLTPGHELLKTLMADPVRAAQQV
ncbi:hypothetical protein GG26_13570, partial [Synechococcus sp. 'PEA 65AY6A-5F PE A']